MNEQKSFSIFKDFKTKVDGLSADDPYKVFYQTLLKFCWWNNTFYDGAVCRVMTDAFGIALRLDRFTVEVLDGVYMKDESDYFTDKTQDYMLILTDADGQGKGLNAQYRVALPLDALTKVFVCNLVDDAEKLEAEFAVTCFDIDYTIKILFYKP